MTCSYDIHHGDMLAWIDQYIQQDDADPFHAAFFDPPYHLTSIVERFGGAKSKPASHGRDGAFNRVSKGFMGASWDGGDIAFQPETWDKISKVLYPGAFGLAAAGSRGYHRMAVAIENTLIGNDHDNIVMPRRALLNMSNMLEMAIETEDWDLVIEVKDFIDNLYRLKSAAQMAGFIIHPAIGWVTVQGFPKGTRIDVQIDEALGVEIERGKSFNYKGSQGHPEAEKWQERSSAHHRPQTEMAKVWKGHRYGLQAMRPLFEFYCLFQKPYPKGMKTWESIASTGAGALNIDGAWIYNGGEAYSRDNSSGQNGMFNASGGKIESDGGRWPPNLILSQEYIDRFNVDPKKLPNFLVTDWDYERFEDLDPLVFAAKAGIPEREAGLDPATIRLMRQMYPDDYTEDVELEALDKDTSGMVYGDYYGKNMPFLDELETGTVNDGRLADSDRPYLRNTIERFNIHPTIKPESLCVHLATILSPPDHYANVNSGRRLFNPFGGSGSEAIGAIVSCKWDFVQYIDIEEKHVKIARVRIPYWQKQVEIHGPDLLKVIRLKVKSRKKNKKAKHEQQEMF